ncbi:hypothetical protein DR999_PMT14207 [Platysternon megacephalum]|uniref:Uncharacterized protein n=1 Tax=Platysternon megacephalum TaxID=55544 RepID=A0A4D9E1N4_9SAUR|nr:hypothetical protein DR999_PMT14207 [Platysternon megacephalum]
MVLFNVNKGISICHNDIKNVNSKVWSEEATCMWPRKGRREKFKDQLLYNPLTNIKSQWRGGDILAKVVWYSALQTGVFKDHLSPQEGTTFFSDLYWWNTIEFKGPCNYVVQRGIWPSI